MVYLPVKCLLFSYKKMIPQNTGIFHTESVNKSLFATSQTPKNAPAKRYKYQYETQNVYPVIDLDAVSNATQYMTEQYCSGNHGYNQDCRYAIHVHHSSVLTFLKVVTAISWQMAQARSSTLSNSTSASSLWSSRTVLIIWSSESICSRTERPLRTQEYDA